MEKELYKLTREQLIVMSALRFIKNKEVLNIALEFEIQEDIDLHFLMQAVNLTVLRNPNNRIRIIEKDKQYYQYFSNDAQEKIEYLEFADEKSYNKYIEKFAQTPFENNGINSQLYRVSVIKKPNNNLAICGCFNHLIYDAYSSAMFFKEAFEIYHALEENKALPKESISPFEIYEEQAKYAASKKYEIDRQYYDSVTETEPQYTILSGKKSKTFSSKEKAGLREAMVDPSMSGKTLIVPIANEFRDQINEYAKQNRITPQILYMLALVVYLGKACETNDVEISCTVNKRSTIKEQKAGGTLADAVELRTTFDNNISFIEALNITYKKLLEVYKHSYFPSTEVAAMKCEKFNTPNTKKYHGVLFTYQTPTKLDESIKYSFKRLPNGREWTACYLNIMPCNSENEYVADYSYMPKLISEENIKDYHNFMVKFIEEGIKNDNLSISDIITKVGK